MLEHFYLSLFIFLVSAGVIAIVLMSKIRLSSKLIIAILLTVSSTLTYRAFNEIRGYPVVLQKSFKDTLVISHMLDKKNKVIYMWIRDPKKKNPRSYTVPFSNKLAQFLEKMRRKHKGKPYRAKLEATSDFASPLDKSIKDVEMGELMVFPPKN